MSDTAQTKKISGPKAMSEEAAAGVTSDPKPAPSSEGGAAQVHDALMEEREKGYVGEVPEGPDDSEFTLGK